MPTKAGTTQGKEGMKGEAIERLKLHLEVAHEFHTQSGSVEKGCDHEEEIKQAIAALEADSANASLDRLRVLAKELKSWNRACLKAVSEGHGPPDFTKFGHLMAEYDRWKYEYNEELIARLEGDAEKAAQKGEVAER